MSVSVAELLPGKVLSLKNVLSQSECENYIQQCEKKGFKQATIHVGKQQLQTEEIRNNDTVIIDSEDTAKLLWERVKSILPENFASDEDNVPAVSLSERLRFYRYDPGQRFIRHYDGYEYGSMVYTANQANKPQPRMTFLVYLNEGFEGGKTTFFSSKGKEILAVTPETGMALVYTHQLLHEGSLVTSGRKYVLRSDVLYGQLKTEEQPQQQSWTSCVLQ